MTPYFILLFVITLVNAKVVDNSTPCEGFQANFNLKDVIGTWHVVAIIPEKMFPEKQVTCYKVVISETDEAGLRWLINRTVASPKILLPNDSNSVIVRQRYHTENPFDVWSKAFQEVNGCFQQVISLDISKKDIHYIPIVCDEQIARDRNQMLNTDNGEDMAGDKTLKHDAMMQLHLLQVKDSEPFLMQMLWGRMIAVVVYRRKPGVTQDELKPVFELMSKLRGPPRLPKICDSPLQDLLVF